MGKHAYSNVSTSTYDTVEFTAAKLRYNDALLFLQRKSDGLLSIGEAKNWAYQISRIFPESRLARTYGETPTPSRKKARLLAKKAAQIQLQPEFTFVFTFKNKDHL